MSATALAWRQRADRHSRSVTRVTQDTQRLGPPQAVDQTIREADWLWADQWSRRSAGANAQHSGSKPVFVLAPNVGAKQSGVDPFIHIFGARSLFSCAFGGALDAQ